MPEIERVNPSEYADTRGQISTYIPTEPIVEYNIVTVKAGRVRGMHWHPLFTEYLLFLDGFGRLESRDKDGGPITMTHIAPGVSTRAVPGVAHAVHAVTDVRFVAMLTRRWQDCDPPIVKIDL